MTLSVGVIGTGVMGAEHVRILREETAGAQVVAVCDADADRARAVAGDGEAFTDPLALIRDDRVQAVVIASPDATHADLALACLAAGKPVLCEKPLAGTAAEALRVVQAEVAMGRRLVQVGYMRRFDPAYADMKRVAETGGIGAPVLLHNIHRNAAAPDWFTGAMAVTNSFVHEIDIIRWLLAGEFTHATAHAAPGGDPLMITLESDVGSIASTEVFMNARYGYHVHAQLVGREGTIEMAAPTITSALPSPLRSPAPTVAPLRNVDSKAKKLARVVSDPLASLNTLTRGPPPSPAPTMISALPSPSTSPVATNTPVRSVDPKAKKSARTAWSLPLTTCTREPPPNPAPATRSSTPSPFTSPVATVSPPVNRSSNGATSNRLSPFRSYTSAMADPPAPDPTAYSLSSPNVTGICWVVVCPAASVAACSLHRWRFLSWPRSPQPSPWVSSPRFRCPPI
jgi:myo-inositol 2-dehydrogenase/D-chiro-inositol 1-dehydrogenase